MSTRSSLMERFGQQVRTRAEPQVPEGSLERIRLTILPGQPANTVLAAKQLVRRHLPLKSAHAVMTTLVEAGEAYVTVPKVESLEALIDDLRNLGIGAQKHSPADVSVQEVRAKTKLSQAQFALKFGLEEATIRNWEQNKAVPNQAAKTLLWIIDKYPEVVANSISNIGNVYKVISSEALDILNLCLDEHLTKEPPLGTILNFDAVRSDGEMHWVTIGYTPKDAFESYVEQNKVGSLFYKDALPKEFVDKDQINIFMMPQKNNEG